MIQLRQLSPNNLQDVSLLQAILQAAPAYHLLVAGHLPNDCMALEELQALPPGKSAEDKFFYALLDADGQAVGCLDLIRGFHDADIAFIGLLLFAEQAQGKGYGPQTLALVTQQARQWHCRALRIAVVQTNTRGLAFWQREGFVELYRKDVSQFTGPVIVMERKIA